MILEYTARCCVLQGEVPEWIVSQAGVTFAGKMVVLEQLFPKHILVLLMRDKGVDFFQVLLLLERDKSAGHVFHNQVLHFLGRSEGAGFFCSFHKQVLVLQKRDELMKISNLFCLKGCTARDGASSHGAVFTNFHHLHRPQHLQWRLPSGPTQSPTATHLPCHTTASKVHRAHHRDPLRHTSGFPLDSWCVHQAARAARTGEQVYDTTCSCSAEAKRQSAAECDSFWRLGILWLQQCVCMRG